MTVSAVHRDDGFTLTELIVVTALLGVILAIAYGGFQVTARGSAMSDRQAQVSREIGRPLLFAERVLTQAFNFTTAYPGITPNRCAFDVDQDGNGYAERYVIEVVGTQLRVTTEVEGGRPRSTAVWSESNANLASGQPLFTYYDADGVPITTMSEVPADVRSMTMTLVIDVEGTTISDSRTMFLRNR